MLAFSGLAPCETLGDARQLSRVGEPLRISIPIRADGGPVLNDRCLAVAAPPQSDGLPHILTANVAVERDGASPGLTITTTTPTREPVVRLLLRTTCDGASRQYTLFLEPAGSTRQMRAVGQPGPRVASFAQPTSTSSPAAPARTAVSGNSEGDAIAPPAKPPVITVIPVVPAPAKRAESDPRPTSAPTATAPMIGAASPSPARSTIPENAARSETAPMTAAAPAEAAAALEAENLTLKQQVAVLTGELQRLQTAPPRGTAAPPVAGTIGALGAPRWEMAWPVLVALAGLAALIVGGFMWRRRHHPTEEWVLTGPPSHRVASRTSLAEDPVPFRQAGVRTDMRPEEPVAATVPGIALVNLRESAAPPASLRLQPSADDLGRDLEQELFIAERAHSALERAHPDIVDMLIRSWGTAAARNHLAKLLDAGSPELSRMSGEAVAELRLLLRVAEDPNPREDANAAAGTLRPPAPAF